MPMVRFTRFSVTDNLARRSAGRWLWFITEPTLLLSMDFVTPLFLVALDEISAGELWQNSRCPDGQSKQ